MRLAKVKCMMVIAIPRLKVLVIDYLHCVEYMIVFKGSLCSWQNLRIEAVELESSFL